MEIRATIKTLFAAWTGHEPESIVQLPGSGSSRTYFRLTRGSVSAIGALNSDIRENEAWLSFTCSLREAGCPVPEVYKVSDDRTAYLMEDLGDETLFARLTASRMADGAIPADVQDLYRSVVRILPRFQVTAAKRMDYTACYPRPAFDLRSMMWDLNYFKYYFLKLAGISYDEEALEEDFIRLSSFLNEAGQEYFMYRDFQSRNVMIRNGEPWFIDYQGGRKGALQYDIASILYDAKADLPPAFREELLQEYLDALAGLIPIDRGLFMKYYHGFVLIRILQALGAYGFRGFYENKPHFLKSIPYALKNLAALRSAGKLEFGCPELESLLDGLGNHPRLSGDSRLSSGLTVTISSFSYKSGIPEDASGHGGGFVFDCRALPNPGRLEEYRSLTGKDTEVIRYLGAERDVEMFLHHVTSLVDGAVRNYVERGFSHLAVNFGCTGGRHRSVYCAEALGVFLKSKYEIQVNINHTEV